MSILAAIIAQYGLAAVAGGAGGAVLPFLGTIGTGAPKILKVVKVFGILHKHLDILKPHLTPEEVKEIEENPPDSFAFGHRWK